MHIHRKCAVTGPFAVQRASSIALQLSEARAARRLAAAKQQDLRAGGGWRRV